MDQRGVDSRIIGAFPAAGTAAIRMLLQPLVRLFLGYGIGLPTLVQLLKEAYVTVAERDFRIEGRKPSDSRVSVMTGVHRKDVRRLQRAPDSPQQAPLSVLIGGQLVARWKKHPDYLDARGKPQKLPRFKRDGGASSFEALAESVTRDVGPQAILDELVRTGLARIDNKNRACLEVAAFKPHIDIEEKADYFGKSLHDHIAVVAHNLRGDAPPFLERTVRYTHLSSRSVTDLTRLAERMAIRGLQQINRRARLLKQRDRGDKLHDIRMTFGTFFYHEKEPKENGEDRKDTNLSLRHDNTERQKLKGKPARRHAPVN